MVNDKWDPAYGDAKRVFDRWRIDLVTSMTLVEVLPEGHLYFCESPYSCNVWVVVGPSSVIVDYYSFQDIERIQKSVRSWASSLHAGVATEWADGIHPPVYGAKEDSETKVLTVVWFSPGDWFGLARRHPLPKEWQQLPQGWPESYRDRIVQLAAKRI